MSVSRCLRRGGSLWSAICLDDTGVNVDRDQLLRFERSRRIACFFPGEESAA